MIYWNCNWAFETFFFFIDCYIESGGSFFAKSDRPSNFFLLERHTTRRKLWLWNCLKSTHFSGSESIYRKCIQFSEESFTWKWFSSRDIIYLFIGMAEKERISVAACQEKLIKCILRACTSWKMSWTAL